MATVDTLAKAPADADPTRTKTLRKRYAQTLRGGFARINTEIRDGVRERDIFGLQRDTLADPPPTFRFETDDAKVEGFREWLDQQLEQEVLRQVGPNRNQYIRAGYQRGLQHAATELNKANAGIESPSVEAVFNRPVHQDQIQLLYTRNFEGLKGITDAVGRQVSRELSTALTQGENPRKVARRLTDRVDSIGKTRATTLARTEIIKSHADATLTRYEQAGVEQVGVKSELQTAGDSRVCPECASLEGTTYTPDEARGIIPVHPQCRCAWIPVLNT